MTVSVYIHPDTPSEVDRKCVTCVPWFWALDTIGEATTTAAMMEAASNVEIFMTFSLETIVPRVCFEPSSDNTGKMYGLFIVISCALRLRRGWCGFSRSMPPFQNRGIKKAP
jgi:hypothetical protein